MRSWLPRLPGGQTLVASIALAVIEEVPFAVVLDLHAPAEFVALDFVVGEPCVCLVGAFDVLGGDDVALRVQHSICSHAWQCSHRRAPQPARISAAMVSIRAV